MILFQLQDILFIFFRSTKEGHACRQKNSACFYSSPGGYFTFARVEAISKQTPMKRYPLFFNRLLFVLVFLATGLVSCIQEPGSAEQVRVYADFYVRYLKPERELKAYAAFLEGSSVENGLSKTFPGGVNFLATAMDPRQLSDATTRYQYAAKANYPEQAQFTFLQNDGKQQRFEAALASVDSFRVQADCSKSAGLNLELFGAPLAADETLLLLFSDSTAHAYTLQQDGPLDNGKLQFTPRQLVHLPTGPLELYLVRKKLIQGLRDNYDFRFAIEYYSDVLTITMGE